MDNNQNKLKLLNDDSELTDEETVVDDTRRVEDRPVFELKVDSEFKTKVPKAQTVVDDSYQGNDSDLYPVDEPSKFIPKTQVRSSRKFKTKVSKGAKEEKRRIKRGNYVQTTSIYQVSRGPRLVHIVIVCILLGISFLAYQYHHLLPIDAIIARTKEIPKFLSEAKQDVEQLDFIDDTPARLGSDRSDTNNQIPLALHEMECHSLTKIKRSLTDNLSFADQVAIAECLYLVGDYANSFRILNKDTSRLKRGSLLLYAILLIKRRQYRQVANILHDRCYVASNNSFFACLGKSLQQLQTNGSTKFVMRLEKKHASNPYSALYWLVQAMRVNNLRLDSRHIRKAIRVGQRATRPVVLAYVYERVASWHFYHDPTRLKQVAKQASRDLRGEHPNSYWWTQTLTGFADQRKRKFAGMSFLSNFSSYAKLYNDLDFFDLIAGECIKLGYSEALANMIRKIQKYQAKTYRRSTSGALQMLTAWRVRVMLVENRYTDVLKILRAYGKNYGKDYFYHFYYGVALMKRVGNHDANLRASRHFSRSIKKKNSWEAAYGYTTSLLALVQLSNTTNNATNRFTQHLKKLERLSIGKNRRDWLFFLKARAKIVRGETTDTTKELLDYAQKHPRSFAVYELLLSAYSRSGQHRQVSDIRRVYDKLQRRIPYYSTTEGVSAPLGAFAFLH